MTSAREKGVTRMSEIWAGTDFPYMCLKDRARS